MHPCPQCGSDDLEVNETLRVVRRVIVHRIERHPLAYDYYVRDERETVCSIDAVVCEACHHRFAFDDDAYAKAHANDPVDEEGASS